MKMIYLVLFTLTFLNACNQSHRPRPEPLLQPTEEKVAKTLHFEGSIKGYDTIVHTFHAKAGQYLNVGMATFNRFAFFNLLNPKGEAVFIGMERGDQFEGISEMTGEYRVQIYLVRAAARRNETANYQLEIIQD